MTISDEQLTAYVDGELDAHAREQVERAIASDPELARRVERQRVLREKLRASFDEVLSEPVPDRLLAAARNAPVAATSSRDKVANLEQVREKAHAARRRWSWPEWSAVAASVVLGALAAQLFSRPAELAPFTAKGGKLVAQAALAQALTDQLASTQAADAATRIGVTFRSRSGEYCRTFVTRESGGLAGVACHQGDDWTLEALSRVERGVSGTGEYRPAGSSLPAAVLQTVQEQRAGEPLDAAAEAAAQENGWR